MQKNLNRKSANTISQHMGERMTMFFLYNNLGWDVEYVDYVGADLIARDPKTGKRYAVSVKTRKMSDKLLDNGKIDPESRTITNFYEKDAAYLKAFADDMKMEPLVAYVVFSQNPKKEWGKSTAHLFLIGLDDLIARSEDPKVDYISKEEEKHETERLGEYYVYYYKLYFGGRGNSLLKKLCADSAVTWFEMEIKDFNIIDEYNTNEEIKFEGFDNKEHWNKQRGTFGEYLALWQLGEIQGMRGYYVDSEGADLVLVDPTDINNQYAVSVKTFTKSEETYQFETKHENNLISFAERWSSLDGEKMKPQLCFNCIVPKDEQTVHIYMIAFLISEVEMIETCYSKKERPIYRTNGGINIKTDATSIDKIKNNKYIWFKEISFL